MRQGLEGTPAKKRSRMRVIFHAGVVLLIAAVALQNQTRAELQKNHALELERADLSFVEGNFTKGENILEALIAANPGDIDLAILALHRLSLSEYLELMHKDWPSTGYPRNLFNKSGRDHEKMWKLISEYLVEAFLETGKFARDGDRYPNDPRENPFLLESLWREKKDFPLTPQQDMSDEAATRILTLKASGQLAEDHPAVVDACVLLVFLRQSQRRYYEASQLVDELVAANNHQVDWLVGRARFHHRLNSSRTTELCRKLYDQFDRMSVDPTIAKAAQRVKYFDLPEISIPKAVPGANKSWISEMLIESERRAWGNLAQGRVDGIEEQIDTWIQGSLGNDPDRAHLMRQDGQGLASTWYFLDEHLKSIKGDQLIGLRKLQEEKCRLTQAKTSMREMGQAEKLNLFRRFPWAREGHLALMEFAREELEGGRWLAGKQAFADIISHSDDPELVKRATVGTWVASAQGNENGKLEMLKVKTALDEEFPWMDKTKTAAEIFETLESGLNPKTRKQKSPTLRELKIAYLRMPPRSLWPQMRFRSSPGLDFVEIQNFDSGVLASTRKVLAAFASDGGSPTWSDLGTGGNWGHSASRVGKFRPIVGKERIYTRWGYSADPTKLIALHADIRELAWTAEASGPSGSRRRIPIGNPIMHSGQIYMAAAWERQKAVGGLFLRISCLDPDTGRAVWHADHRLQGVMNSFEGVYGESLSIADDSIYCSPSLGLVGRFDLRDGSMHWMHNYDSLPANQLNTDTLGSAPIIVGESLVSLPRDTNLMFALDKRTGRKIWDSNLLLPREILGNVKGRVLVYGLSSLFAVDAISGELSWQVIHPERIMSQPSIIGRSVYLASNNEIFRYDAETGIKLESMPLPKSKSAIRNVNVFNERLYLITDEPAKDAENNPAQKSPDQSSWEISAINPQTYLPQDSGASNRIFIHEDELLHCLEASPEGKILWQRFVHPRPNSIHFIEGKLILLYNKGSFDVYLKALEQDSGDLAWELTLPRIRVGHGATFGLTGKYLYGRDNSDRYCLVDLSKGKVVMRNRISRRNGTAKAGMGGGKVQFLISTAHNRSLHWLNWDLAGGHLEGHEEKLKGEGGIPSKSFDGNWLEFAQFGSHACYFICRDDNDGRKRTAYKAYYKDRKVQLLGMNPRNLKFEPPYLFMQQEEIEQNRKRRTHTWALQREDDPSYSHSLELPHSWQHKPSFINERLLEVRTPVKNQNPYTVRIHDLKTKRVVVEHASEDAERMGAVAAGPEKVLVYAYKRHNRGTEPYFKLTPYDLRTGQAGATMEINYWTTSNQTPIGLRVAGDLVLVSERNSVKAWQLQL